MWDHTTIYYEAMIPSNLTLLQHSYFNIVTYLLCFKFFLLIKILFTNSTFWAVTLYRNCMFTKVFFVLNGTLMQIRNFHKMLGFISKQYLENFTILNLRNLELFTREFWIILKSRLLFNIFYCFCMFINKHFVYLGCVYLKN